MFFEKIFTLKNLLIFSLFFLYVEIKASTPPPLSVDFIKDYYNIVGKDPRQGYLFLSKSYQAKKPLNEFGEFWGNKVSSFSYKITEIIENTPNKKIMRIEHRFNLYDTDKEYCENKNVEFLFIPSENGWKINESKVANKNCGEKTNQKEFIEEAQSAINAKNYKKGIKILLTLASVGNAEAQFHLSEVYKFGLGVAVDQKESFKWLMEAANGGFSMAQNNLASILKLSNKPKEAAVWFEKSAMSGSKEGQYNYGMLLLRGRGVEKSHTEAFKWIQKSAQQNNAIAQYDLSIMHKKGEGTKVDLKKSLYWMMKAVQDNDLPFPSKLYAYYDLSVMYEKGAGTERNIDQAIYWAMKARGEVFSSGIFNLYHGPIDRFSEQNKPLRDFYENVEGLLFMLAINYNRTAVVRSYCDQKDTGSIKLINITDNSGSNSPIIMIGCKSIDIENVKIKNSKGKSIEIIDAEGGKIKINDVEIISGN